jgi:transcriptional regulator with XRE-family HTH domain
MRINDTQNIIAVGKELASRLKDERINQGFSQGDIIKKTGLSASVISKLENGFNVRLFSFLLYLKAINKVEVLNDLIPEPAIKPSDVLKLGKKRQRVSHKTVNRDPAWKWGDEK